MDSSDSIDLQQIKESLNEQEMRFLSPLAAHSKDAIRRFPEERIETGHRQNYAVDSDRILHSLAYTRYIDKTQVFYLVDNDHITHRVLHVQLVSKISRTIGRFLGLNEDLIEAIALGHDIGHCPFGHDGEGYLSRLCEAHGIGPFQHNLQSVRFLEKIERKGRGWNLTLQVLDGIMCHDGEIHSHELSPDRDKTFARFDEEMARKGADPSLPLTPMTLEGCVVRMADTISYIGRDIEDAIRLNLIERRQLPRMCVERLGDTNGTIVYTLVTDLIKSSFQRPAIAFSQAISEALKMLKEFNLNHIYLNPKIKPDSHKIKALFELLFERYLRDLQQGNEDAIIFREYLDDMSEDYLLNSKPEEIVRDFIAGMTDQYFLKQCPEELRPRRITGRF
ncbi:MAG: HD domain-containing protein [Deltaproteobacteria bacterium]|nr:HD domain-containing protein [Deltaproteobacteria bacterium]MBW2018430.1 HD domain-containing protein [Deltaproteobacteria bacterium]MBW2073717.1 HD domain-containing protein [Deltaproteobacteria bacterium]RLB83590.1 MAG: phosphohydrolase [Deltaproteobacteria bacterium]